jgi:hypothetical protein
VISGGENRINAQKCLLQTHFFHYELHKKSHPESNSGSADRNLLFRRKICLPRSSRLAVNRPSIESDQAINQTNKESVFHSDWRNPFFFQRGGQVVTHPAFYLMGTGDCFDGLKAAGSLN